MRLPVVLSDGFLAAGLRVEAAGRGGELRVVATRSFARDELLTVWGGAPIPSAALLQIPRPARRYAVQIEEDVFLLSREPSPADRVNHSCEPNAGLRGQVVLVAMAPIAAGEEVTYDYAMTDSAPYDEFECACQAPRCRGRITGGDWELPELQSRYRGYFSSYLERRIAERAASPAALRAASSSPS